ncbi:hypothetical protein HPB47_013641, partial [Ixodes persulcatus]
MAANQDNFRSWTLWTEGEANARNPTPLKSLVATSATHGHSAVSFQPSSLPSGGDQTCPKCAQGIPLRDTPAHSAERNAPVLVENNSALAQSTATQQRANTASYCDDLLTPDWPAASSHTEDTAAVCEQWPSSTALCVTGHTEVHGGTHPVYSSPAESASHQRENALNSYQPLLDNAARVIESLKGALQTATWPPPPTRPPVRISIPTHRGDGGRVSATDFLEDLKIYQQAMGMSDNEILERILPVSLVDQAARCFRLTGNQLLTIEQFRKAFRQEFLPADYERRMRRELEQRTQHPDESLLEFVRAMQELFEQAEPSAPQQSGRFRDLNELASEARRIQGDILAARAYRPPPPASSALEPRCAWNGETAARNRRHEAAHYADGTGQNTYDISDRALDPYYYERRTAEPAPQWQRRDRNRQELPTPRKQTRPMRSNAQDERPGAQQNVRRDSRRVAQPRCFRCNSADRVVRQCPERQNP